VCSDVMGGKAIDRNPAFEGDMLARVARARDLSSIAVARQSGLPPIDTT
jgi:hypothetical protein